MESSSRCDRPKIDHESNAHGVLDHDVTLPSGETIHNPMRVLPNAGGSEVVFSVFRRPGVDDATFDADTQAVTRDLHALKAIVETKESGRAFSRHSFTGMRLAARIISSACLR